MVSFRTRRFHFDRKLNETKRLAICASYQQGKSADQLGTEYGVAAATIRFTLSRYGITCRSRSACQRVYAVNESAFDAPSEARSYWIGFLMGDGNVTIRKTTAVTSLSLGATDQNHLFKFRQFLGSNHPISVRPLRRTDGYKDGESARIDIASAPLARSLAAFGVVPRKSLTTAVIGLEHDRHFWRGVVDADGSVFISEEKHPKRGRPRRRPIIVVAGAEILMKQFSLFCATVTDRIATVRRHSSIWTVRYSGRHAIDVVKALYGNCSVALDRKMAVATAIFHDFPKVNHLKTMSAIPSLSAS